MNYTIKKGDNLTKLSKQFGVSISDLVDLNGVVNPDKIRAGDSLYIPVEDKSPKKINVPKMKPLPPSVTSFDEGVEEIAPETMLMGMGIPAAMGGVLAKLARVAPQAAKAGRILPPTGYSNIVPVGNSAAFNSSMAQAIKNAGVQGTSSGALRRIPNWLRDGRTEMMMKQNPSRTMGELGAEALTKDPRFSINAVDPEISSLEDLLLKLKFGG